MDNPLSNFEMYSNFVSIASKHENSLFRFYFIEFLCHMILVKLDKIVTCGTDYELILG